MFTDEEAKGAEGAKNEQQEGREELIVKDFVTDVKSESEREYQEWAAGRQRGLIIEDDEDIIGDDTATDLTSPKHPKLHQNVEKLFAV